MAKETQSAEPVKPNLEKVAETEKLNELDDATKARLQAAENAKIKTQTGKLNVQPAKPQMN